MPMYHDVLGLFCRPGVENRRPKAAAVGPETGSLARPSPAAGSGRPSRGRSLDPPYEAPRSSRGGDLPPRRAARAFAADAATGSRGSLHAPFAGASFLLSLSWECVELNLNFYESLARVGVGRFLKLVTR